MGHLKWTLETFLKAYFERDDIVLRLRPSYFPFTEPSAEVDVGYKQEKGRRIVGGHGDEDGHAWMELLGSGMVNARVIANRSEEHTSELQSLMRISYAVFCLKKKKITNTTHLVRNREN